MFGRSMRSAARQFADEAHQTGRSCGIGEGSRPVGGQHKRQAAAELFKVIDKTNKRIKKMHAKLLIIKATN